MQSVIIDRRYNGPPESGNGGYVCGVLANAVEGPCTVTLRKPPPLSVTLDIAEGPGGTELRSGGEMIAMAVPCEALDIVPPTPPTVEAAADAVNHYEGFTGHAFSTCFVCGPERDEHDGLRIFTGPVDGTGPVVAAPWTPDKTLAGDDGQVHPEFLWSALDCPGFFAIRSQAKVAVLGRLSAEIRGPLRAGEQAMVIGWPIDHDGRKHQAGTAIFDSSGNLAALGKSMWIAVADPTRL